MNTQLTVHTTTAADGQGAVTLDDPRRPGSDTAPAAPGYRAPAFAPALTHAAALALRERARYLRACMASGRPEAIVTAEDVRRLVMELQATARDLSEGLDALDEPVSRRQLSGTEAVHGATAGETALLAGALRAASDRLLLTYRDLGAAEVAAYRLHDAARGSSTP